MKITGLFIILLFPLNLGMATILPANGDSLTATEKENEIQKDSALLKLPKNLVALDLLLSFGGFIGLEYERSLGRNASIEIGIAPTYSKNPGVIIPFGLNFFLPFGSKHRVGATVRLLFYSGGMLTPEEEEGSDMITAIATQGPSPAAGVFYQFNSDYSVVYRFVIGAAGLYPFAGTGHGYPAIELKVGYIF